MRSPLLPFVLFVLFVAIVSQAAAQTASPPTRTLRAVRLNPDERLTIDGRLSEEAWLRAEPAANFRQEEPLNGEPATEQTEVRILYDEHRIVLGVRCLDSEPTRLFGNQMQRDQSIAADDRFMFAIDTYSDGRSGYYFEINPSGAMGDGLVSGNGTNVNRSWDGLGRHLGRACLANRHRLDGGNRNSAAHDQLCPECNELGHQLPTVGQAKE